MAAVCAAMYSGGLCSDKMSTERIVAREPVARNFAAAMNSNGFRLSLISPRRSRTNHREDIRGCHRCRTGYNFQWGGRPQWFEAMAIICTPDELMGE